MDLNDYDDVGVHHLDIYGPPKSGKTALAGKLANHGFKLKWFDGEKGVRTLLQSSIVAPENRKNVSIFNIPDHRTNPCFLRAMRELWKGGPKKFCFAHGTHNCPICNKNPEAKWSEVIDLSKLTKEEILVIDSTTQLANSALNMVTLSEYQKDPEEFKPTFNHFGQQGMLLDEIYSKIQASHINVICISHDIDVEKSESKEKIVPVGGTRNFSKTFAKYFDEVIYMQVMNKAHKAYNSTTWDNIHLTGGRSGVKLEDSKELDLIDIFKPKA